MSVCSPFISSFPVFGGMKRIVRLVAHCLEHADGTPCSGFCTSKIHMNSA